MSPLPNGATNRTWRLARKVGVSVLGASVIALGVALIAAPVPGAAVLFIPLGLAILAREFLWAERVLDRVKQRLTRLKLAAQRLLRRPLAPTDSKEQP